MTFNEAKQQLNTNKLTVPCLSDWKHLKSGTRYTVVAHSLIEATLEPCVIYIEAGNVDGVSWVRPTSEFIDGRFARSL